MTRFGSQSVVSTVSPIRTGTPLAAKPRLQVVAQRRPVEGELPADENVLDEFGIE